MQKFFWFILVLGALNSYSQQVLYTYYQLTPEQQKEYDESKTLPFDSLLVGLKRNISLYSDSAKLKYLFLSNDYLLRMTYFKQNIDESAFYELRRIAEKNGDTLTVQYAHNYKYQGLYHYNQGNGSVALEFLKKAYDLIQKPKIRGPHNKMDMPYTIAHVCKNVDDIEGLIKYSQICIIESRRLKVPYYEIACLINVGGAVANSDSELSIDITKRALHLGYQYNIFDVPSIYYDLYRNLMVASVNTTKDYKAALVYADSCIRYSHNTSYPVVESALLPVEGYRAIAYHKLGDTKNANICLARVDSIISSENLKKQFGYFIYQSDAAWFYQQVNQVQKSYGLYNQSIRLFKSSGYDGNMDFMLKNFSAMAQTLIQLKDTVLFDDFYKDVALNYTSGKSLDSLIKTANYIVTENLAQYFINGLFSMSNRPGSVAKIDSLLTLYENIYRISVSMFTRFDYSSNTINSHTSKLKSCANSLIDNGLVQHMSSDQLKRFWLISSAVKSFDLVNKIQAKEQSYTQNMQYRKLKSRLNTVSASDTLYNQYFDEYLTYSFNQQLARLAKKGDAYDAKQLLANYRDIEMLLEHQTQSLIIDYYITDSTLSFFTIKDQQLHFGSNVITAEASRGLKTLNRDAKTQNLKGNSFFKLVEEQLAKVLDDHTDFSKITFIADGELLNLPFEVVNYKGKLLVSSFSTDYNYSPYLVYLSRKNTTGKHRTLLAVAPVFDGANISVAQNLRADISALGDDYLEEGIYRDENQLAPLPHTASEVKAIGKYFAGKENVSLVGKNATERNVRNNIATADIVHFATHGYSSTKIPELSRLVLSDYQADSVNAENDAFLFMDEIYELPIKADLVVLSACKTGTGKILEGEGVMALPRGFIYAGVPNVIASLWKVHDEKTKNLMVSFYMHLLEDKVNYAEALRRAKLDCIAKGYLPMDWAGFVLIGG